MCTFDSEARQGIPQRVSQVLAMRVVDARWGLFTDKELLWIYEGIPERVGQAIPQGMMEEIEDEFTRRGLQPKDNV